MFTVRADQSPSWGSDRSAATAAPLIRVITDADVGPVKGVAELCVIQLADGAVQVILVVKLHNPQDASPVPYNIGERWLHHLAEMILQGFTICSPSQRAAFLTKNSIMLASAAAGSNIAGVYC